jgi:hypothetical protein
MRYLKNLGLIALAVTAFTSAVGAGSASAAVLCKTKASPCPEHYPVGTAMSGSLRTGTTSRVTSTFGTITCQKSTFAGKQTQTTAHGEITSFTFSECTGPAGQACTMKAVNLPWTYAGTASGSGNGTIAVTARTGGLSPGFSADCGSWMNCTFTMSSFSFAFFGGAPAILSVVNTTPIATSGFPCPAQIAWEAEYVLTAPSPAYLI